MIRLVVSDIDGTLLQHGAKTLSPSLIQLVDELLKKGIMFCAASGREYSNLYRLFRGVQDQLFYIGLNGAEVIKDGTILCKTAMDDRIAFEIIRDILARPNCEALVSSASRCFVKPKQLSYVHHMAKDVGNDLTIVNDLTKIGEPYLKISCFNPGGIEEDARYFMRKYGRKLQAVVSGACWFDFTAPMVNKGNALQVLQSIYGINQEDTVVLGDSFNDLEMFEQGYYSYAMSGAHPKVQQKARYIADDVESVLLDILRMR